LGGEDQEDCSLRPVTNKLGTVVCTCNPSYTGRHKWEYHSLRLALDKNARPYPKNKVEKCIAEFAILSMLRFFLFTVL
jgi:hypothetical protein